MFYYIPAVKTSQYKMPAAIEKCVRKQSIRYMHNKNHFSLEYFQFMRRLLMTNVHYVQLPAGQDKLVSIELAGQKWSITWSDQRPVLLFTTYLLFC